MSRLTVLAGCFLVHGHVAQPLFVGPMFLGAYGLAWRRMGSGLLREHRVAHLVSAGCIMLFLVPLVIDLWAGANSNFARILEFEADHPPGKPLWKALAYFCAFFGYVKNTELFLSTCGPERGAALGTPGRVFRVGGDPARRRLPCSAGVASPGFGGAAVCADAGAADRGRVPALACVGDVADGADV